MEEASVRVGDRITWLIDRQGVTICKSGIIKEIRPKRVIVDVDQSSVIRGADLLEKNQGTAHGM